MALQRIHHDINFSFRNEDIMCVPASCPRNNHWNKYGLSIQYNIEIEKKEPLPVLDGTVEYHCPFNLCRDPQPNLNNSAS
jgi:hypothetical protein